jgi:hypothetical protein
MAGPLDRSLGFGKQSEIHAWEVPTSWRVLPAPSSAARKREVGNGAAPKTHTIQIFKKILKNVEEYLVCAWHIVFSQGGAAK